MRRHSLQIILRILKNNKIKINSLLTLLAFVLIAFTSCASYCAECVEANTGIEPADYCGKESDVDDYISELKSQGSAVGQSWSCDKVKENYF